MRSIWQNGVITDLNAIFAPAHRCIWVASIVHLKKGAKAMRLSSYFRSLTATLGAIVLLSACQSSGMAPSQVAAVQAKSAPSAIANDVDPAICPLPSGYISPKHPTIKPHQRKTLHSIAVTWRWVQHRCVGYFSPFDATWQSSKGGHLSSTHGTHVEFWAGKPNVYTVIATGFLFKAQATVTVKS
jgi:hypothetical protein